MADNPLSKLLRGRGRRYSHYTYGAGAGCDRFRYLRSNLITKSIYIYAIDDQSGRSAYVALLQVTDSKAVHC